MIAACRRSSPALDAEAARGVRVEAGVDVTSDDSVAALARRLDGVAVDELVCNAGILRDGDLDDFTFDDVREQLEVNAIGPLRVVRALRGHLARGAKVALVTSRMGSIGDNGSGGSYGYRMSKAALNAAGVSLARDLAAERRLGRDPAPRLRAHRDDRRPRQRPARDRGGAAGRPHRRADAGDVGHVLARERPGPPLVTCTGPVPGP